VEHATAGNVARHIEKLHTGDGLHSGMIRERPDDALVGRDLDQVRGLAELAVTKPIGAVCGLMRLDELSLQSGLRDLASQLGLATLPFIDAVKERTGIQPDGQAMAVFRRKFHVVMTGLEHGEKL